ncbi:NACHT and TPR domain-containing protein [Sodiomyces alkalinus F11]|uniref:NACHT and TPR domain-containing protein n=1 Tax=Sodiomyces alkalinus (strain CBS 110278 / VKM F-3762 / F11) TaxID=1314773 RepID=A0A3N2PTF5_SODAK|nr:NACHT and TPR domain-containing protein [Sodiomyces alkalinus F11]ROT37793.1 NACHT and TPR domain-containing protein [Sodiomyces alkalinus F11]
MADDQGKDKDLQKSLRRADSNMQRQFAAVLRDAQRLYSQSGAQPMDLADFLNPPMRSVEDLLNVVNHQNDQFEAFRARRQKLFHALSAAMGPLELIGGTLAEAAAEAVFPPSQGIFAAAVYLINTARNVSSCYDSIVELFEKLCDFTARLKFYLSQRLSTELHEKIVQILVSLFEILVVAAAEVRQGRLRAYFKRLFGKGSPVDEPMRRLTLLTEAEGRLVGAESLAGVKKSLSNQDRLLDMMSRLDINVQTLRSDTRESALSANKDRLRHILRPSVHPQDTYEVLDRTRTPNTCDWLLRDPSLHAWVNGSCRFLWICGNMGSGKSYLAARLIRWGLRMLEEQDANHMLGYVFFRHTDPETRSVVQALRDVAYQLSEIDVFYGKQLLRALHSSDDIKTVASAFRRILVEPCIGDKWKRHIYVILDGLDEADPAELTEFLSLLDTLHKQSPGGTRVQVALIGRNAISDIVLPPLQNDSTGGQQLRTLHVTPDRNGHDVVAYIVAGVNEAHNLRGLSPELKMEIVRVMAKQVDGLFILAKFMLSELSRERHMRGVLERLQSYPKEINGMLRQSILRFSETITVADARDLNEVLQWVCCAETALTLEQIEAILSLKFGDPPLHLEESLRTHFASFFTLEREDGLSTADLVERYQQQRALAAERNNVDEDNNALDPAARRSPDLSEAEREVEFHSNKETTWVTFFHASVHEFFLADCSTDIRASPNHPSIGFNTAAAKLHVLDTCLRLFTDADCPSFGFQGLSLQRYAARYWQEHLAHLDRAALPAPTKATLGKRIYTMLTDRPVILAWTNLFEESLEIWSDKGIDVVRAWMADPDVVSGLADEGRAWAAKAVAAPVSLLEPFGRIFAQAWLKEDFGMYIPTLFCFGVVQSLAMMDRGAKWSDSVYHWEDVPAETRVQRAALWSRQPKTGHLYRRIGSTLLTLGHHNQALLNFDRAMELDRNIVETCGRIGVCYYMAGNYKKALNLHLMSNVVEEKNLREKKYKTHQEYTTARWRFYKNLYQIAQCYRKLGRVESAVTYCCEAIKHAYDCPAFEPEAALMMILAENNRVAEITRLLDELDERYTENGYSRLVYFLLDQIPSDATRDWIPDAAARTNRTARIARRYQAAIKIAQEEINSRKEYYLRNALGRVYMSAEEYDKAIIIQEAICFQEYRPRGSIAVRVEYASSFRNLASLYYLKALQEGDGSLRSPAVDKWTAKLEKLQEQQRKYQNRNVPQHMAGFDVNEASIFLVLFYRFRDRVDEAKQLASSLVMESLDILEDDEPQNDEIGIRNLQRILIAAGDEPNARALCQSTRKPVVVSSSSSSSSNSISNNASGGRLRSDRQVSSPRLGVSPKRGGGEMNLTKVFSEEGEFAPALACDYCMKRFEVDETYAVCMYCIDTRFCLRCLENAIKLRSFSPGHTSACGPNHNWLTVPALEKELQVGEIIVEGAIQRITEWKRMLHRAYMGPARRRGSPSPSRSPHQGGLGIL